MQFAPIVPINYYPASLSNLHMILSHELVVDKEYRDYYINLDTNNTIILDNGTVETGDPQPELLLDTSKYVSGAIHKLIVVAPDYLGDNARTVKATRDFFGMYSKKPDFDIMIVPQGKDWRDWLNCLEQLKDLDFEYIGLPRITEEFPGGRQWIFSRARQMIRHKKYHLLGIQQSIWEVEWAFPYSSILGVDSSLPLRAVANGLDVLEVDDLRSLDSSIDIFKDIWLDDVRKASKTCSRFVDGRWKGEFTASKQGREMTAKEFLKLEE